MAVPSPLRLARLRQGKTLQDVAIPANIGIWKLSLIERGLQATEAELMRLSGVLGIPVSELQSGEGCQRPALEARQNA
jgi:hypothetical protein